MRQLPTGYTLAIIYHFLQFRKGCSGGHCGIVPPVEQAGVDVETASS